jgi:uncharacterized protein (UPF0333 family)
MKFLKTKNISKFSINDRSLIAYPDGVGPGNRVVVNAKGGMMLPKGTTAQRPQLSSVRQPTDANGTIRYNTSLSSIEAYVGGTWVIVASPVASAIVKQTLGPGDGVERVFGPLNSTAAFLTAYSASDDNIIVLVENVMQISTTNYTVVQSNGTTPINGNVYAAGWYINFTSAVPASGGGGNPVYVTVYYGYAN